MKQTYPDSAFVDGAADYVELSNAPGDQDVDHGGGCLLHVLAPLAVLLPRQHPAPHHQPVRQIHLYLFYIICNYACYKSY